jgi:protein-L-isoaspartate(D-aspartate) O-methyltransferase
VSLNEDAWYTQARQRMVAEQIEGRGLRGESSQRLLAAMRSVPRHCFVPENQRRAAYQDGPLPIGQGQTISQPYIVALMTHLLDLNGGERVLEIGTGSGYQAAILSVLAAEVHTLERHARLALRAAETLAQLGYANVAVHTADGSLGWQPAAPYAAILVTAAAPEVSRVLLDQLAEGGRLILPVGNYQGQELQRWTRRGAAFAAENIIRVSFVPLRGAAGWNERDWQGTDQD